jgi:hypothetical protein
MLRTASVILIITVVFSALYAILLIVSPQTIAESTLQARTGKTGETVQEPDVYEALVIQTRHLGIMALATCIALFFILFVGFSKGEQWAWWAFLITGIIVWGYGLAMQISEGDQLNGILHSIGIVLLLIGVFLPVKTFFAKTS